MSTWLVTGANGNLGRRLVQYVLLGDEHDRVVAVVRRESARASFATMELSSQARERLRIEVVDYTDVDGLRAVAQGCDRAVHLVGIIKETRHSKYVDAHEGSTQALIAALTGSTVTHVTYLSIVGSEPGARNACLASKGRAEAALTGSSLAACVLRVPMVLGEGDYASFALRKRANQRVAFGFRVASLEQPIYAGDVIVAIGQAASRKLDLNLDIGGPEVLSRRALIERAASLLGRRVTVLSLPISLGYVIATLCAVFLANPPVTPAMLEVLDHDDHVNAHGAADQLGMPRLTTLEEMLRAVLA